MRNKPSDLLKNTFQVALRQETSHRAHHELGLPPRWVGQRWWCCLAIHLPQREEHRAEACASAEPLSSGTPGARSRSMHQGYMHAAGHSAGLDPVSPGQQRTMLRGLAFQQMCKRSDLQGGLQLNEQPQKARPNLCILLLDFLIKENAHEVISLGIGLWELSGAVEHHLPENTLLVIRQMRDTMGLSGTQCPHKAKKPHLGKSIHMHWITLLHVDLILALLLCF